MFGALERFGKEVQRGIYHAYLYNAIVVIQIYTLCGDLLARADIKCPRHRTEKGERGRMGGMFIYHLQTFTVACCQFPYCREG